MSLGSEVRDALLTACRKATEIGAAAAAQSDGEAMLTWRRSEDGSAWNGTWVRGPDFFAASRAIQASASMFMEPLKETLSKHAPLLLECHVWLGYRGGIANAESFVHGVLSWLYRTERSVSVVPAALEHAVDSLLESLNRRTAKLRCYAPLPGLTIEKRAVDSIQLSPAVRVAELADDEVNVLWGGSFGSHALREFELPTHALIVDYDQEFTVGEKPTPCPNRSDDVAILLRQAVVWITSFKAGRLVVDTRIIVPLHPLPFDSGVLRYGTTPQYLSHFTISPEEVAPLSEYASCADARLATCPSFEIAARRLADSGARLDPIDALTDAVVGLEALLLADDGPREGLRFRFALNYAHFDDEQDGSVRHRRWREAYSLYGVRSTMVHGSSASETYSIADRKLSAQEVAAMAQTMLREVLQKFVRLGGLPSSKGAQGKFWSRYWEEGYFGLRR